MVVRPTMTYTKISLFYFPGENDGFLAHIGILVGYIDMTKTPRTTNIKYISKPCIFRNDMFLFTVEGAGVTHVSVHFCSSVVKLYK